MGAMPTCPICDHPADLKHAPFCSQGCRDRDLIRWLSDGYRVPTSDDDEDGLDSDVSPY